MCKEWPGPRCAGHTRAQFIAKSDGTRDAALNLMDAQRNLEKLLGSPDVSAAELTGSQARVADLTERLKEAEQERQDAKEVWASTPGGHAELTSQYVQSVNQGNSEEAEDLLNVIKAGEEIKAYRAEAQKIAAEAYRNVMGTPEEVKSLVAQKVEKLNALRSQLMHAHEGISDVSTELDNARKEEVKYHAVARKSVNTVKSAQEKIRRLIVNGYIEAGVPEGLAEHFAVDSIASMQEGWHYLSSAPGDKFPKFKQDLQIKLKSSSPETYEAAKSLAVNQKFNDARTKLYEAVEAYNDSVQTLQEKKNAVSNVDNNLYHAVQAVEPESLEVSTLKEDILEIKSLNATGLTDKKLFSVDFGGFVKSGYLNPDGSSNAFVRLEDVGGKIPAYVQVDKVVRTGTPPHVILRNGIKLSVDELRTAAIKLVPPHKGAKKLIS